MLMLSVRNFLIHTDSIRTGFSPPLATLREREREREIISGNQGSNTLGTALAEHCHNVEHVLMAME